MARTRLVTAAIVTSAGVVLILVVVALGARGDGTSAASLPGGAGPDAGKVFDAARGDPVDVEVRAGKAGTRCIAMGGDPYLTSEFCASSGQISRRTAYTVAAPIEGDGPVVVVGFVPRADARAVVMAGDVSALGVVRGRIFLAELPANALDGGETVRVEFG